MTNPIIDLKAYRKAQEQKDAAASVEREALCSVVSEFREVGYTFRDIAETLDMSLWRVLWVYGDADRGERYMDREGINQELLDEAHDHAWSPTSTACTKNVVSMGYTSRFVLMLSRVDITVQN